MNRFNVYLSFFLFFSKLYRGNSILRTILTIVTTCGDDSHTYNVDTGNPQDNDLGQVLIIVLASGYWKSWIEMIVIDSTPCKYR